MNFTNVAQLPKSLYWTLTHSDYELEPGAISVTRLIDSPRIRVLQQEFGKELVADASDSIYAMLGTAVHRLLAFYPDGVAEKRYCATYGGLKVCGTPDLIEDETLYDYKVTSTWVASLGLRDEWENQLNVYRWLARQNGIIVNSLKLVAIFRDWSQSQMEKTDREGYPDNPAQVYDIRMWSLSDTEKYVDARLKAHLQAEEELPLCTPEERWQRDGVWAVYYNARARAERLLHSELEARNWVVEAGGAFDVPVVETPARKGYSIVRRPDQWRRCEHYCSVSRFCAQWHEFNNGPSTASE